MQVFFRKEGRKRRFKKKVITPCLEGVQTRNRIRKIDSHTSSRQKLERICKRNTGAVHNLAEKEIVGSSDDETRIIDAKNKNSTIFCRHCNKRFDDEIEHDNFTSSEEKRYYCHSHSTCTEKFTRHELIKHCKLSGVEVPSYRKFFLKALSKNPRMEHQEKLLCEICSESFDIKKSLEEHYETHNDQYTCDVCFKGFKKILDYTIHMQTHSEDKMFKCPLCDVKKEKGYQIRMHILQTHEQFKKFKCEVCNKRFANYPFFQEHVKYYHSGEKPFKCEFCSKKYYYSQYLATHQKYEHLEKPSEQVECFLCNVKLPTLRAMQRHHRSRHPKELLICDICGKYFKSKKNFSLHSRVHSGDKRHKCSYCEKRFIRAEARKEHERIHTGDRPYRCSYCGKSFTQRTSMVIHTRNHTGERPYVCHLCNKGYTSKANLTHHLKSCLGSGSLK